MKNDEHRGDILTLQKITEQESRITDTRGGNSSLGIFAAC